VPRWDVLAACAAAKCPLDCNAASRCNPVTNAPCDTQGAQCMPGNGSFNGYSYTCGQVLSNTKVCDACSDCGPTQICLGGSCARYCCNDADCGAGGTCNTSIDPSITFDGIGICVAAGDGGITPACNVPPSPPSNGACYLGLIPHSTCNPVTNAGCPSGTACDLPAGTFYECLPLLGAATPLCGVCGPNFTVCGPTETCVPQSVGSNKCARYCCDDGDCGGGGKCDPSLGTDGVGICVTVIGLNDPACGAPATAPSQGSCFKM
jgi:hypothetical protein